MPGPCQEYPASPPPQDLAFSCMAWRRIRYWKDANPGRRRPSGQWALMPMYRLALFILTFQLVASASHHSAGSNARHGMPTQRANLDREQRPDDSILRLVSPSRRRNLKDSRPDNGESSKDRLAAIPCPQNVTAWGRSLQLGGSDLPKFKWTPTPGKTIILLCDQGQVRPGSSCYLAQSVSSAARNALPVPRLHTARPSSASCWLLLQHTDLHDGGLPPKPAPLCACLL